MCGPGEETADLKLLLFFFSFLFPLNQPSSSLQGRCPSSGGTGAGGLGGGTWKRVRWGLGGVCRGEVYAAPAAFAGFIHGCGHL